MMLIPKLFRFLFQFNFFKKRYFGIYKKLILPKNLFKGKTTISTYDETLKIKLDIEEWIQQQIFLFGYFDKGGILFLQKNLKEGDTFIDVGANIGAYSLIASKGVGKTGKVISFEPVGKVYSRLIENVELNHITNTKVFKKALMDESKIIDIHVADNENTGTSSIYSHENESGKVEQVEGVVFDNLVNEINLENIDLIKMDIEGAEYFAISGMQKSLKKYKPKILIEISDEVLENAQYSAQDLINLIISIGYEQFSLDQKGNMISIDKKDSEYHNFIFTPTQN